MKDYSFFPGCSLDSSSVGYDACTRAVCRALEVGLTDIGDWNCCNPTSDAPTTELTSLCASARNLALAQAAGEERDLVTPCSLGYAALHRTNSHIREYPQIRARMDEALAAGNLKYSGDIKVRHLLDIFVNDIGCETIRSQVKRPLNGLKMAAYYGCQITRPDIGFDDPELPHTLDDLMKSLGADLSPFPLKNRCCGGSLITSEENAALDLIRRLLDCASGSGAQCIVAVCPVCQINLDAYQGRINKKFNTNFNVPVLFFTQLMGVALGIGRDTLGLKKNVTPAENMLARYLGSR